MITEDIVALRARLVRAEKLATLGEFAEQVAHEIKNPLAPIRGYAQLLLEKLDSISPAEREVFERGLGVIQQEAERIDRQLLALLRRARVARTDKTDRIGIALTPEVVLNQAIRDVVSVAMGEASRPLRMELDGNIDRVVGEGDEIRGVLLNLLKNALEAMEHTIETACVLVRSYRETDWAVIEVIDEGCGLSEEAAKQAFQPFFTTKPNGTGLGLAIARSTVERIGGTIEIEGRPPPTGGAVVRVRLLMVK